MVDEKAKKATYLPKCHKDKNKDKIEYGRWRILQQMYNDFGELPFTPYMLRGVVRVGRPSRVAIESV